MDTLFRYQTAAFDTRDFLRLKQAVKRDETGLLIARQVEGLFIEMMLKNMRSASFNHGLADNQATAMFTAMHDQQIARHTAGQGQLGLANAIAAQLSGATQNAAGQLQGDMALSHIAMEPIPALSPGSAPASAQRAGVKRYQDSQGDGIYPGAGRFIASMLLPSVNAGRKSGIPHQLLIAQAALESGWGRHEIRTAQGKPTHNLFAIKSTAHWPGESTEITTTEFINGVAQRVKASFKVYPSYTAAFNDYINLLLHNPRYKKVVAASSAEMAAQALQYSGYATDPHYSEKLINIISKIKSHFSQVIDAYKKESSPLF